MSECIDIVTVAHNDKYQLLASELYESILSHEGSQGWDFIIHDNRVENLGFAKGCNMGVSRGSGDIIGFLNPDVYVNGQFMSTVRQVLSNDGVKVTGNRFNKPWSHLREWGVKDWVCGATFFTTREHFENMGGFDEGFEWSFEETDFIRRTELAGYNVKSINLPIMHSSPKEGEDTPEDAEYKAVKFAEAQKYYLEKWG